MIKLIKRELLIQNQIYNLIKYLLIFFTFAIFTVTLINSHQDIAKFGIIFSVASIPLAFINLPATLIKPDIEDGTLELILLVTSSYNIAMSKFCALYLSSSISFMLALPFSYLIFNIPLELIIMIISCGQLILILCSALVILIASIQSYFRSNTNFLSILIMPLIIPSIILSGILLQNPLESSLLFILLGINLILVPVSLYLSSYLIDNIYNM